MVQPLRDPSYDAEFAVNPQPPPDPAEEEAMSVAPAPSAAPVALVIEDDDKFASIVRDLSRELGFQCLVAGTAEDALKLARQFKPSAVVLDVGLPDESGLMVLDRLKRDDATRHIPIHVISGADHSQTALSLGAIGYMIKPVKRDDLAQVLTNLQS